MRTKVLTTDEYARLKQIMNTVKARKDSSMASPYSAPALSDKELKQLQREIAPKDTMERITQKTYDLTGVTLEQLRSTKRSSEFSEARKVFSYLASEKGMNCSEIGRYLHRDHSTVIHQLNSAKALLDVKDFRMTSLVGMSNNILAKRTVEELAQRIFDITGFTHDELLSGGKREFRKARMAMAYIAEINCVHSLVLGRYLRVSVATIYTYQRELRQLQACNDPWLKDLQKRNDQWEKLSSK